jgi:hypothetical protein
MRYYAAWLCRFVSVDPLQFEYPELTPFQYASNRPVTGIDMDGLEFVNSSIRNQNKNSSFNMDNMRKVEIGLELMKITGKVPSELDVNLIFQTRGKFQLQKPEINLSKSINFSLQNLIKTSNKQESKRSESIIRFDGQTNNTKKDFINTTVNITSSVSTMKNAFKSNYSFPLLTLAQVLYGTESPSALLLPITFAMTEKYNESDYEALMNKIKQGFDATLNYVNLNNKKEKNSYVYGLDVKYLDDDEFIKVISGEVTSMNQLEGKDRSNKNLGNAVFIKSENGNDFVVHFGFHNINEK